jgi:hypothetical protein
MRHKRFYKLDTATLPDPMDIPDIGTRAYDTPAAHLYNDQWAGL